MNRNLLAAIIAILILDFNIGSPVAQSSIKLEWINFGPYTKPGQSPGAGIMPESQIIALLDSLQPYVEGIRTYGTQKGLEKIPGLAKQRGLNVMVGIYLSPDINNNNIEIANAIAISNAGHADRIIVGGEVLYNNFLTPLQLISYINQVKAACPTIPVTTADVYFDLLAHPEVADVCDFIFPNIYPYYEGQPVECAIQRFDQIYQSLLPLANGKEIVISETGWKTAGPVVGDAYPSFENALRYHRELLAWSAETGVAVTVFSAFDEPWKIPLNDDGWGIFFSDATLKPGMDSLFTPLVNPANTWTCSEPPSAGSDTIVLDYIPVNASFDNIQGHINYLNTCDYSIATYIKVGPGWWTKPTFGMPSVPVLCNGDWDVDYTAGGNDHLATDMCFFIIPTDYAPPPCSGCGSLPTEIYNSAIAYRCITRYMLPAASAIAADAEICKGDSTSLTALGGSQFLWSTGETTASVMVSPVANTTYSVTITDGMGGGAIATVMVRVLPTPVFSIMADPDTILTGGNSLLMVTGNAGTTFQWSTGASTNSIEVSPTSTTTYYVTATGANGCSKTDSVTVIVNPLVSTTEKKRIKHIDVFPLPADEILYLNAYASETPYIQVSLHNGIGHVLAQRILNHVNNEYVSQFDVSAFPPGIYFLMIQTSAGETRAIKVPVY